MRVLVACQISRGAFPGERVVRFKGEDYAGTHIGDFVLPVPVGYCWRGRERLRADEPDRGDSMRGFVEATLLGGSCDGAIAVEITPDVKVLMDATRVPYRIRAVETIEPIADCASRILDTEPPGGLPGRAVVAWRCCDTPEEFRRLTDVRDEDRLVVFVPDGSEAAARTILEAMEGGCYSSARRYPIRGGTVYVGPSA